MGDKGSMEDILARLGAQEKKLQEQEVKHQEALSTIQEQKELLDNFAEEQNNMQASQLVARENLRQSQKGTFRINLMIVTLMQLCCSCRASQAQISCSEEELISPIPPPVGNF